MATRRSPRRSQTAVPAGQFISATATDPDGDTSEFAQDVTVTSGRPCGLPAISVRGHPVRSPRWPARRPPRRRPARQGEPGERCRAGGAGTRAGPAPATAYDRRSPHEQQTAIGEPVSREGVGRPPTWPGRAAARRRGRAGPARRAAAEAVGVVARAARSDAMTRSRPSGSSTTASIASAGPAVVALDVARPGGHGDDAAPFELGQGAPLGQHGAVGRRVVERGEERQDVASSRRHSIPRAPCPTAGRNSGGAEPMGHVPVQPQPTRAPPRPGPPRRAGRSSAWFSRVSTLPRTSTTSRSGRR